MKNRLYFIIMSVTLLSSYTLLAQNDTNEVSLLTLEPIIGTTYDFSAEAINLWSKCDSLDMQLFSKETYTQEESNALFEKCHKIEHSMRRGSIWNTRGADYWTDEGYNRYGRTDIDLAMVSSALKPQNNKIYDHTSVSDLSYKTAWIEGVKGYGIGEFIQFHFLPAHPTIRRIIIANGYIKDKATWKNNARVKQLKVYLNDKTFVILNLKDIYAEQIFEVPAIQYQNDKKMQVIHTENGSIFLDAKGNELPLEIIRFEIMSVYKGDKYEDTAISEIYFDGIDVH